MKHKIEGTIIETCNCEIISFLDTSEYVEGVEITNPMMQIFPPNWDTYFSLEYNTNSITVFKPEHIGHGSFPSGVYHFKQSICPNDKVLNEFCYLNICCERNEIAELYCGASDETVEDLVDYSIKLDIAQKLVAKGKVKEGSELYNIIRKKLNKLSSCETC